MQQELEQKASVNLNIYVIRFKKKGTSDKELLKVNDVLGNISFEKKMQEMITFFDIPYVSGNNERMLYIHQLDPDYSNDTLNGLFRRGVSSEERYIDELRPSGSSKKASQVATIKTDQYTSTHFFFSLCQPKSDSTGILFVAQSFKQYGFKEVFEESFRKYLAIKNPDVRCFISQLSVPALYDKIIDECIVKKLTFKRHGLPTGYEDSFLTQETGEEFQVSLSVQAKKNGFSLFKKTLKSFKEKDTTLMEIFPLENFEYQDLSAEVFLGGKRRVLNMKKPTDLGTYYDITDDIEIDGLTKHPVYESIKSQAQNIIRQEILPNITL